MASLIEEGTENPSLKESYAQLPAVEKELLELESKRQALESKRKALKDTIEKHYQRFFQAAKAGKVEDVRILLLEEGNDVNAKDNDGETPLHDASKWGKPEVVELLLAHDEIEVNAKGEDGSTPLHWASNEEIKDLLKAKGGR